MSLQSPTSQQQPPPPQLPPSQQQQQQQQQSKQPAVGQSSLASSQPQEVLARPHQAQPVAAHSSCPLASPDTRTHVVGELYDTERSYVESLQILVEKYMKPLKSLESNRALIDSGLVGEIFYTIPELLQHHETFLRALQDRLSSDWDTSQVIGNVFIEAFTNQQIIDTYTAFINNWKLARQAIKLARQAKPAFERYLEAMSREHRNKLTLDALLIMPVQRIPRYELLIKELIKHTPDEHPDYGPLIEAQKEIHELALKIDRAEREMLHQEQLRELETLIEGHAELQQPQRDFIRYDLVTISGTLALTGAKKERVLFLFCDLLIMTSVKKKASRRSNLQSAFANSTNDLSLLEGSKFKLLLRVPLDQVEIRLSSDQVQQQQLDQLHHSSRLVQGRRRELEADLAILHQIESLSAKISQPERSSISETINELSMRLRQRLVSLEQTSSDLGQATQAIQQPLSQDSLGADWPAGDAPAAANLAAQSPVPVNIQYQQQPSSGAAVGPGSLSGSANSQHDSDTSLEFIISNCNPSREPPNGNLSAPAESPAAIEPTASQLGGQASADAPSQPASAGQPAGSCETLTVTFSSTERRQAFLLAFVEAKQQRYQMQQQRQHQHQHQYHQRLTALKPGSPERRAGRPDLSESRSRASGPAARHALPSGSAHAGTRIASAPLSQRASCGATIVHQMSAPQSLAATDPKERSLSQCASCSSSSPAEHGRRHHHHHQLMHQPASQPATLDTVCCFERHRDEPDQGPPPSSKGARLGQLEECPSWPDSSSPPPGELLPPSPKFLLALPMSFSTQHPALQFTCSAARGWPEGVTEPGELWLCLSNGYVSHVALVSLRRRAHRQSRAPADGYGLCYSLSPLVRSAGDICQAHISCAVQVLWPAPPDARPLAETGSSRAGGLTSRPVDIGLRSRLQAATDGGERAMRLSESAPSHSGDHCGQLELTGPLGGSSASCTRLELPRRGRHPLRAHSAAGDRRRAAGLGACCPRPPLGQTRLSVSTQSWQQHLAHHSHHSNQAYLPGYAHQHHHAHSQQHHHSAPCQPQHYDGRHHTVPLTELRRALERQHRSRPHSQLIPPVNTPAEPTELRGRATTPPVPRAVSSKSFRSARLLRHQASLKTSSILAKLVRGASRRSSQLRKSARDKKSTNSDLDDNDTDTDAGSVHPATSGGRSPQLDSDRAVVSPLSSVSSLNSTNSSLTVNSACASSPNQGSCERLVFATCCQEGGAPSCGLRGRSATVPSRVLCQALDRDGSEGRAAVEQEAYRVSEILADELEANQSAGAQSRDSADSVESALWLGCDDGHLIVIDCLCASSESAGCGACEPGLGQSCGNLHSEVKLAAPVCDIRNHKDELVLAALANGQLAVFSRANTGGEWFLSSPKLITVCEGELGASSKLCLVDEDQLWYAHGRSIFVLSLDSLELEGAIVVPASAPLALQAPVVDGMEPLAGCRCVWVSFRNSHLLQLYEADSRRLLAAVELLEPVQRALSQAGEIIRQHRSACLRATSLLAAESSLFVGTSAGLVLQLSLTREQLQLLAAGEPLSAEWRPQPVALLHGHSGPVRFLRLARVGDEPAANERDDDDGPPEVAPDAHKSLGAAGQRLVLVSGGAGVELHGCGEPQQVQISPSNEDDNLNHLLLWQL